MKIKISNSLGRNLNRLREADRLTPERRSSLMSKIRSRGTRFEKDFIMLVRGSTKKKFSLNDGSVRGTPDMVFLTRKICVFLDSDFWHGWQYPRWKHLLKNDFWRDKIDGNRKRDTRNTKFLRENGWIVLRFWEHNIKKDAGSELSRLTNLLRKNNNDNAKIIPKKRQRGAKYTQKHQA